MAMVTDLVSVVALRLLHLDWKLTTAESCTGGMIAAKCTDLSGSSAWFERGFVTYANEAKSELLGVSDALILKYGAVSDAVARAMALGACYRSKAQVSIAVTGIAGPGGGSHEKPVGTVWLAWCIQGVVDAEWRLFPGDRAQIRQATAYAALEGLIKRLPNEKSD
ncbi:damage-inducible protein CinA [Limnohabitans sp. T6-5]|uniref:CinA family protein n=1 Tax=Limnohabitans sp. T6-5 TaxID=1100724 RepID=UPI000D3BFAE3|nr:CinA family protein [Limnohabitans sp. T6-5]PUE06433.1 damage-inducible protein CinA [Limnohabitans sp. T6-5]